MMPTGNTNELRVSPHPIPELEEFLQPYRHHFYRIESLKVLERWATGLLTDIDRKSGARVARAVAGLSDKALYRLMTETEWDEAAVNRQRIETMVNQAVAGDGMLVFDETGLPRKGDKCVGVARQYCGELGKVANCQVMVTADYVDPYYAWPVWGRLYLPESWCEDPQRRQAAQIPEEITFQTKPQIALDLLDEARAAGVPISLVGGDSLYGDNPTFLDGVEQRELGYVVGVSCDFGVRLAVADSDSDSDSEVEVESAEGVPLGRQQRADAVIDAETEAEADDAWQTITWRQGSEGPLSKQFVAVRAWRSHGDKVGSAGWLIGERPRPGHEGKRKYYWSNLGEGTPLARLSELAHRRPGIERGYQDGKGETGLKDYSARLWPSFHRYVVIQFLVLSWLLLQRPLPENPEIVLVPQEVDSEDEPVFPLRTGAVLQREASEATGM